MSYPRVNYDYTYLPMVATIQQEATEPSIKPDPESEDQGLKKLADQLEHPSKSLKFLELYRTSAL